MFIAEILYDWLNPICCTQHKCFASNYYCNLLSIYFEDIDYLGPTNPSTSNLSIPLPEVSNKRDDALQNVAEQKQKIKAIKGKISNV